MNVSKIGFYGYTKPVRAQRQEQKQAQTPIAEGFQPSIKNNGFDNFRQNLSFGVQFTKFIDTKRGDRQDTPVRRRRLAEQLSEPPKEGYEISRLDALILKNEETIKSFGKQGLPLTYSRRDFSKKIFGLMAPSFKFDDIQNKMGIQLYKERALLLPDYRYNGILTPEDLSSRGREGRIKEECQRFLYNNWSAANSGDINEITSLIIKGMPEFINCVGKQQDKGHDYSVDIHSLMVIINLIKDPRYKTLSDDDRFVLKMTALLHDIAKPEAGRDPYHAFRAEALCNTFIKRYNMTPDMNARILKGIGDHQWLKWYNISNASDEQIDKIVAKYDSPTDYIMALMFAKADLAATSKQAYDKIAPLLEDEPQRPLREAVEKKFNMKF